jgi:hypothetical protein
MIYVILKKPSIYLETYVGRSSLSHFIEYRTVLVYLLISNSINTFESYFD